MTMITKNVSGKFISTYKRNYTGICFLIQSLKDIANR